MTEDIHVQPNESASNIIRHHLLNLRPPGVKLVLTFGWLCLAGKFVRLYHEMYGYPIILSNPPHTQLLKVTLVVTIVFVVAQKEGILFTAEPHKLRIARDLGVKRRFLAIARVEGK